MSAFDDGVSFDSASIDLIVVITFIKPTFFLNRCKSTCPTFLPSFLFFKVALKDQFFYSCKY